MIMEITALRARLTDLEEENLNLKQQIRKEVQEEYEALVQALFVTCLHIKVSEPCWTSGQSCGSQVWVTSTDAAHRAIDDRMGCVVTRACAAPELSGSKRSLQRGAAMGGHDFAMIDTEF